MPFLGDRSVDWNGFRLYCMEGEFAEMVHMFNRVLSIGWSRSSVLCEVSGSARRDSCCWEMRWGAMGFRYSSRTIVAETFDWQHGFNVFVPEVALLVQVFRAWDRRMDYASYCSTWDRCLHCHHHKDAFYLWSHSDLKCWKIKDAPLRRLSVVDTAYEMKIPRFRQDCRFLVSILYSRSSWSTVTRTYGALRHGILRQRVLMYCMNDSVSLFRECFENSPAIHSLSIKEVLTQNFNFLTSYQQWPYSCKNRGWMHIWGFVEFLKIVDA